MASLPRYTVDDFFRTVAYYGASFSPDGTRVLVSANPTGVFNVYTVPLGGGEPEALTDSAADATYAVSYFRADDRVLFTRDRGGDERHHLFVREVDGAVRDLTPGAGPDAGHRARFVGWSRAGDRGFVATNERDAAAFDVYAYATDAGGADPYARVLLYENPGGFSPAAVSPDGRYVALERAGGRAADADVFVHDCLTGRTGHVTPHAGAALNRVAAFDADGRGLLYTTDGGGEFARLERMELTSGERAVVLAPPWDVAFAVPSPDGRWLAVGVNADARTVLHLFAWPSMQALPAVDALPAGATVADVAFSADGRRVAFHASASRAPNDLYVAALDGLHDRAPDGAATDGQSPRDGLSTFGEPRARRLTNALGPHLDPAALVEGRVVRFAAPDGVEVPGVLYVPNGQPPNGHSPNVPGPPGEPPRGAASDVRSPAVVLVHGGPGGQARLGWHPVAQLLANRGCVVFDVNNRGSSGYGRTFSSLDTRRHGEADLGDVVAARDFLAGTGLVDPARVAVMGASYGGYLVLAALAFHPAVFAAGVDLFGPSDWVRTLESLPAWLGAQRDALYAKMGDPAVDGERLRRVSPLFAADNIRRPLLVLQGANDARVLPRESDAIVAAVRGNGVPVEYLVFPDEGHGIVRYANQVRGYGAVARFLDQHLLDRHLRRDAGHSSGGGGANGPIRPPAA